MTHCAIVPFITVAHIHFKRILTFSLMLECVFFFQFLFSHIYPLPCLVPNGVSGSPSAPGVCDLSPSSFGLKWHQLLSPFSSREWCSVFSTSPPVERQRLNLNTVYFLFIDLCLSFRNCFCITFFLLRE